MMLVLSTRVTPYNLTRKTQTEPRALTSPILHIISRKTLKLTNKICDFVTCLNMYLRCRSQMIGGTQEGVNLTRSIINRNLLYFSVTIQSYHAKESNHREFTSQHSSLYCVGSTLGRPAGIKIEFAFNKLSTWLSGMTT